MERFRVKGDTIKGLAVLALPLIFLTACGAQTSSQTPTPEVKQPTPPVIVTQPTVEYPLLQPTATFEIARSADLLTDEELAKMGITIENLPDIKLSFRRKGFYETGLSEFLMNQPDGVKRELKIVLVDDEEIPLVVKLDELEKARDAKLAILEDVKESARNLLNSGEIDEASYSRLLSDSNTAMIQIGMDCITQMLAEESKYIEGTMKGLIRTETCSLRREILRDAQGNIVRDENGLPETKEVNLILLAARLSEKYFRSYLKDEDPQGEPIELAGERYLVSDSTLAFTVRHALFHVLHPELVDEEEIDALTIEAIQKAEERYENGDDSGYYISIKSPYGLTISMNAGEIGNPLT